MKATTLDGLAQQERMRRELLNKSDLVPPLPDFVVRLLGVLNKPETEPSQLESYLQNDQVLVAKLLGMVNSPFYGLNRTVTTIKDAVMVLGFRGVRSLVLASSTARFLQCDYSCYGHSSKGLWQHAVCVAAGARQLAPHAGLDAEAREQLFVAGLLHDIGKLLLAPYLTEKHRNGEPHAEPSPALERELVGIDHSEAGALVCAKWNLSREVQELLTSHHDDTLQLDPDLRVWAACVRLADSVAHELGHGYEADRAPGAAPDEEDIAALNLTTPGEWSDIRTEMVAAMETAMTAMTALAR